MSLIEKFKKDVSTLRSAANGDIYLDVKSPKLYKKVRRYYENNGVVFSGDPLDDYEMLMDYLYQDLQLLRLHDESHQKPTVLMERFPYRYVQVGKLEINGMPDCRIQKVDSYTGRYRDMYLCDNEMQLMTAMEDFEYTKLVGP